MLVFVCSGSLFAQQKLPVHTLKDKSGRTVNTADVLKEAKGPIVISFWATWCKPCLEEQDAISEHLPAWQDETGVRYIAVSIDDSRTSGKVATTTTGRGWPFEVWLDPNSELKRLLSVNLIPHTFLLDKEGNVVWQHTSYAPGDEEELYEKIKEVAGK